MKREEHNFYKLGKIVYNEVNAALRTTFKAVWDAEYPTRPWNDDAQSAENFKNEEITHNANMNKKSRDNLKSLVETLGNRAKWDLSLLAYALIFSRCLGLKDKNPRLHSAIDTLRDVRNNKFAHLVCANCTENDFKVIYADVEKAIKDLPSCTGFIRRIRNIRKETNPPSAQEYHDLKMLIDNDRKTHHKGYICQTAGVVSIAMFFLSVIALCIPGNQQRKWSLPKPEDWFVGRQAETENTIDSIINGTRVHLYRGATGFGKTSCAYVVGNKLFEMHGFDVMFVSLRGISDVQSVMDEIYFIGTRKSAKHIDRRAFIIFLKELFHKKVLIILDGVSSVLRKHKEGSKMKELMVTMLDHNQNIHLLCTSQISFLLINYKIEPTIFLRLSDEESAEVLQKISPDIKMADAMTLGGLCAGVPILLTLYGHLIHSKPTLTANTVISQISKFGVLTAFDFDGVPMEKNIIEMLNIFFCMTDPAIVDAFLKLVAVYPNAFTITSASRVLELPIADTNEIIGKLESFSIINVQDFHADGSIDRLSIHPLLLQYSTKLATYQCTYDTENSGYTWSFVLTVAITTLTVTVGLCFVGCRIFKFKLYSNQGCQSGHTNKCLFIHESNGKRTVAYFEGSNFDPSSFIRTELRSSDPANILAIRDSLE